MAEEFHMEEQELLLEWGTVEPCMQALAVDVYLACPLEKAAESVLLVVGPQKLAGRSSLQCVKAPRAAPAAVFGQPVVVVLEGNCKLIVFSFRTSDTVNYWTTLERE